MWRQAQSQRAFEAAAQQFDLGNISQARQLCSQLLMLEPEHAQVLCLQGNIARAMGQTPLAVELISKALEKEPSNATFWDYLGLAMQDLGYLDEAIQLYRQGLAFGAQHLDLLTHLAKVLAVKGRVAEADACFQQALQVVQNNPGLLMNYGNFLMSQGRANEAVAHYKLAIQVDPGFALAHFNLGSAAFQAANYAEAISHFESAIRLNPAYEPAYFYMAYAYKNSSQPQQELAVYQQLAKYNPSSVMANSRMGIWHENKNEIAEATTYFSKLVQLQPDQSLWQVRLASLFPPLAANTAEIDAGRQRLSQALKATASAPFGFSLAMAFDARCQPPSVLAYQGLDDCSLKSQFADWMVANLGIDVKQTVAVPLAVASLGKRKIKVGFLVTENHERVFKRVLGGYLQHFNRDQLELQIICPAGRVAGLQGLFTELDDVGYLPLPDSIEHCVATLRQSNLDVLFFFEVGTDVKNYLLSLYRFAPVQCTSWGYPTTSGSPNMDYYISSALIEPENAQAHYREKLLLMEGLPTCFKTPVLPKAFKTRAELGLPEAAHLYVCPQTLLKFHPDFDAILTGILTQDPEGLILLPEGLYPIWTEQLQQRFQKAMPQLVEQIRFLPQLAYEEYLSLLHHSDVLLDPLHFGGGLTTYEMLALGKPIVTLPGASLRGRFTLGCYRKMGLMDCVVDSAEAYIALALKLANDAEYRQIMQEKIQAASSVLFEDMAAVRQMEQLLTQAVEAAAASSMP